jgi:predicted aldo/keto reductase-like oxidoreductase
MQYRRFGRTELQIPVFSCGGMRYQHKWQDVPPEEVPAVNQANLEATIHHPPRSGTGHQPYRDGTRLRVERDAVRLGAAQDSA